MTTQTPRQEVRLTPEEWRKTHRDFKTTIQGQSYVLRWAEHGTALVPVVITKETGK